jgi:cell division protein FtsW
MINKTLGNIFKGDKVIWMVFFFLCMISIVEVFSASSELTYKGGSYLMPLIKHCGMLIIGCFLMVCVVNVPCKYFKLITPFLLIISFLTLLIVLFVGQSTNGAQRWMGILGFKFQPSELAKGALVLGVAQILSAMQTDKGAERRAFKYVLITSAFFVIPIMLENLSTAVLLAGVVLLMMFIGRVPLGQIGRLLGVVAIIVVFGLVMVMAVGTDRGNVDKSKTMVEQVKNKEKPSFVERTFHRADTWKARIDKFLNNKEITPQEFDLDKDAQVAHANIAIASSNVVGKGPGNSVERDFLSQAFSDFIYAIVIEETGIEGAAFVAILYIILLFRAGRIANRCENNFPAFLAMGLALLLVVQALFNMLVAVGLAPVTGQPLPLISRGGTSTIINCVYIGAILSISRTAKKKEQDADAPVAATATPV